jgi:hypothetical protein
MLGMYATLLVSSIYSYFHFCLSFFYFIFFLYVSICFLVLDFIFYACDMDVPLINSRIHNVEWWDQISVEVPSSPSFLFGFRVGFWGLELFSLFSDNQFLTLVLVHFRQIL